MKRRTFLGAVAAAEDIDRSVIEVLRNVKRVSFPELEKLVLAIMPDVGDSIRIRQSAWRLIRRRDAELNTDLTVSAR